MYNRVNLHQKRVIVPEQKKPRSRVNDSSINTLVPKMFWPFNDLFCNVDEFRLRLFLRISQVGALTTLGV